MKRVIYLILVLFVIVTITGVALAVKPENPGNPGNDPLTALWNAVNGLQDAVNGLLANDTAQETKIVDLQTTMPKVAIVKGGRDPYKLPGMPDPGVPSGTKVSPPEGFTTSDCEIIVQPVGGALDLMYGSYDTYYHAHYIDFHAVEEVDNTWTIWTQINWHSEDMTDNPTTYPPATYTIICSC